MGKASNTMGRAGWLLGLRLSLRLDLGEGVEVRGSGEGIGEERRGERRTECIIRNE